MQLEETVSRNGKNMVVLSLDIAQGEQKGIMPHNTGRTAGQRKGGAVSFI